MRNANTTLITDGYASVVKIQNPPKWLFESIEAPRSVIFTVLFHVREVLEGLEMALRYLTDGMRSAA